MESETQSVITPTGSAGGNAEQKKIKETVVVVRGEGKRIELRGKYINDRDILRFANILKKLGLDENFYYWRRGD
jgi:hypothetical protein